jgi:hypothetical protein
MTADAPPDWLKRMTEDLGPCDHCGGQDFEFRNTVRAFVTTDPNGTLTDFDIKDGINTRDVTAVCLSCHEPVN